jgi:hypothetical protein
MPRQHPTVLVPNIGPMDHAWDLLGEWQTEFELPETESPVHGKVTFRSWTDAELQLDPIEAAIAGIPTGRSRPHSGPARCISSCMMPMTMRSSCIVREQRETRIITSGSIRWTHCEK